MASQFDDSEQFTRVPFFILEESRLTSSAKVLFARITPLTKKEGYCWASSRRLAQMMDCTPQTINRLLRELSKLDYLTVWPPPEEGNEHINRKIYLFAWKEDSIREKIRAQIDSQIERAHLGRLPLEEDAGISPEAWNKIVPGGAEQKCSDPRNKNVLNNNKSYNNKIESDVNTRTREKELDQDLKPAVPPTNPAVQNVTSPPPIAAPPSPHDLAARERARFMADEAYIGNFCVAKKLSRERLVALMAHFCGDLALVGDISYLADIRRHFLNWFKVGLQKGFIRRDGLLTEFAPATGSRYGPGRDQLPGRPYDIKNPYPMTETERKAKQMLDEVDQRRAARQAASGS